jgi:hypothetical protein
LAAPIEPREQEIPRPVGTLFETAEVPLHSKVVIVPVEFRVQPLAQDTQAEVPGLPAPLRDVRQRLLELLAGGSALHLRCAAPIRPPAKLKA